MTAPTVARTSRGMTVLERDLRPIDDGFLGLWDGTVRERAELVREARTSWASFRAGFGYRQDPVGVLTLPESQPKTGKSATRTLTLMLSPERSVLGNACPAASRGCAAACLNTAGKGSMSAVQHARLVRSAFFATFPAHAGVLLGSELLRERVRYSGVLGFRPNCVSDIRWERVAPGMLGALIGSGFAVYDYTAYAPTARDGRPDGYTLTYSAKEHHSDEWIGDMVRAGHNVAVPVAVRKGRELPDTWRGLPAIDGDKSDWRPGDPSGVVVLLRAKGSAIGESSGFVRSA